VFRALLAHDFTLKGGLVVFPGAVSATLEVAVKSMVEVAGRLESRMVCLERLVELTAYNLYNSLQVVRTHVGLEAGPPFPRWWSVLRGQAGYQV
jgi:hypothetical protein